MPPTNRKRRKQRGQCGLTRSRLRLTIPYRCSTRRTGPMASPHTIAWKVGESTPQAVIPSPTTHRACQAISAPQRKLTSSGPIGFSLSQDDSPRIKKGMRQHGGTGNAEGEQVVLTLPASAGYAAHPHPPPTYAVSESRPVPRVRKRTSGPRRDSCAHAGPP